MGEKWEWLENEDTLLDIGLFFGIERILIRLLPLFLRLFQELSFMKVVKKKVRIFDIWKEGTFRVSDKVLIVSNKKK